MASLGDQPERRRIHYLILGNSDFRFRCLYTADVKSIAKNLSMCNGYLEKSKYDVSYLKNVYVCNDYLEWDTISVMLNKNMTPPPNYQTEMIPVNI